MPNDFTQESVLQAWIAEYNKSLLKGHSRAALAKLKRVGWADDNGLSLELLKKAAATWQPPVKKPKPPRRSRRRGRTRLSERAQASQPGAAAAAPAPSSAAGAGGGGGGGAAAGADAAAAKPAVEAVTIAKVFAMISSTGSGYMLHKVVSKDYPSKCLQFSARMVSAVGAEKVAGSEAMHVASEREAKQGPLGGLRFKHIKDLPATLPAGYQIGVTSQPEWGFTKVGNHWFMSAGGGFYLDNTVGIASGALMTQNLVSTTGDQWASRVASGADLGKKLLAANPALARAAAPGGEVARQAIKAFVKKNPDYHPRVWTIEPTEKAAPAPVAPGAAESEEDAGDE